MSYKEAIRQEEKEREQLELVASMYPSMKKILQVWRALLDRIATLIWLSVITLIGLIAIVAFVKSLWFVAFIWRF